MDEDITKISLYISTVQLIPEQLDRYKRHLRKLVSRREQYSLLAKQQKEQQREQLQQQEQQSHPIPPQSNQISSQIQHEGSTHHSTQPHQSRSTLALKSITSLQ